MSDTTGATGGEAIPQDLPADAPEAFNTPGEAAAYFTSLVEKRNKSPAESAEGATAEPELSGEDNAAPEKVPGENAETDSEEQLPPVERPRSWSKDDDDEWNAYPRARQEQIAAAWQKREADINQKITKAAETTKAAEAKAAQAEQAEAQYKAKLPVLMQSLVDQNNKDFSNIKSMADVEFLANEAVRLSQSGQTELAAQYQAYLSAWQVHQQKMAGVKAELDQAEHQSAQKKQYETRERQTRENSLLIEKAPEYSDAAKLDAAQKAAAKLFHAKGFTDGELANIIDENPILVDHRMQLIVDDARKYQEIIAAPKAIAAKPLPPVQRPGTSRTTTDASEREQTLTRKPELSVKEATELYEIQSRRQRRA